MSNESVVVAYDSDCLMCSRSMQLLMRLDHSQKLWFTSLQQLLPGRGYDSILVWDGGHLHQKSQAAIQILRHLGGLPRLLAGLMEAIPTAWLDAVYDFIAERRHLLHGNLSHCQIPSADFLKRLIGPEEIAEIRLRVLQQA